MVLKMGHRSDLVKKLQKTLAELGFHPGPVDGHFGPATEGAVEAFQSRERLLADGVVGKDTANAFAAHGYDLLPPTPVASLPAPTTEVLAWVKCPADRVEGYAGYSRLTLRQDAAEAYKSLYAAVRDRGGVVTTAGGRRSLRVKKKKSTSTKSFHYVGRAFDLAIPTGLLDPYKDPYIIQYVGDRKWLVWCRTDDPSIPEITIRAAKVKGKRTKSGKRYTEMTYHEVTTRAFCFTHLAAKYGFEPIRGRRWFFSGGPLSGAEWWHFQYEDGLVEGVTTFGEELLRAYSPEQARKFIYWDKSKDCRFGLEWF